MTQTGLHTTTVTYVSTTHSTSNNSAQSSVIYGHNSDIITWNTGTTVTAKIIYEIRKKITGVRNEVLKELSYKLISIEIENHVDTHYFCKYFIPFSWTGLVCSVSPFLLEYKITDDVYIC